MRSLKLLSGLGLALLALGLAGRAPLGAAVAANDDLRRAFQTTLDAYMRETDARADLVLGELRLGRGWAYAVAQERSLTRGTTHPEYVVLLARAGREGWDVLAPLPDLAAYNARLDGMPEALLDTATKAFIRPIDPDRRAATFSGHLLPWPVGKNASVGRTDASGHIGQVDFGIENSIFATKPGTVVFVKEVTPDDDTAHCGTMSCWTQANMVVIQHGPSEYSWYVHVKQNSVPVEVGSYVNVGTKVGEEGWNGYSTAPHLHYMVSSGATAWTNPADRYAAPWGTGIAAVDFVEAPWTSLFIGQNYRSQNASDPGVAATAVGRYDLFVRGENNDVYRRIYQGGAWGATWAPLQAVGTSGVDAVSRGAGDVDVYVRGLRNEVWHRETSGGLWRNWLSLGFPAGGATGDPGAAWKGGVDVDVFTRGSNGALYSGSIGSTTWTLRDGVLTSGADAYYCGNSRTVVTLRGVDRVWARTINGLNGAVTYGAWEDLGNPNGSFASSDPSVVCTTTSTDVFVRGQDKQLYQKTKTGSTWPSAWTPRGGFLTSGPDATSWGAGHMAVFVRGDTGAVFNLTFTNGVPGAWGPSGGLTTP